MSTRTILYADTDAPSSHFGELRSMGGRGMPPLGVLMIVIGTIDVVG